MSRRCGWARDALDIRHHDEEWGVPEHDDRRLFEFLILEGAQAGLSWLTILRKREAYRRVFAGFDPAQLAKFTKANVQRLMEDDGIVRNRAKIEAAITNARAFLVIERTSVAASPATCGNSWVANPSRTLGDGSRRSRLRRRSPEC
jgi:DNA-3-methyladenine glycosylase I